MKIIDKIKDMRILIYFQSDEGDIEFDGIKSMKELDESIEDIKHFVRVGAEKYELENEVKK